MNTPYETSINPVVSEKKMLRSVCGSPKWADLGERSNVSLTFGTWMELLSC